MRSKECDVSTKKERKGAPVIIRHLRATDSACTAEIDADCFSSTADVFKETDTHKVVVATQARTIVGYIRFDIEPDHIYLSNVCVASDARGMDLCQKLVAWLIGKLKAYKRTQIKLIAWPKNAPARHCYAKLGFKPQGGDKTAWDMSYELKVKKPRGKKNKTKSRRGT